MKAVHCYQSPLNEGGLRVGSFTILNVLFLELWLYDGVVNDSLALSHCSKSANDVDFVSNKSLRNIRLTLVHSCLVFVPSLSIWA